MYINFLVILFALVFCVQIFIVNANLTEIRLTSGQQLDLNYTGPSSLLPSGYRIFAPHNHNININCLYNIAPKENSTTQSLYVQLDHTADDTGGETFYNSGIITKQSLFNYAIITLKTDDTDVEPRGQFQCRVDAIESSNCRCGWGRQVVCYNISFFKKNISNNISLLYI